MILKPLTENISNLLLLAEEDYIEFIYKEKKFKCNKFTISLMSTKIFQYIRSDSTFNSYIINSNLKSSKIFQKFIDLTEGSVIKIEEDEVEDILQIFSEFECQKYIEEIIGKEGRYTIQNILKRIAFYERNHMLTNKEIDYAAEHFYELSENELVNNISNDVMHMILSSNNIKLNNEDKLLDLIIQKIEIDNNALSLLQHVQLTMLSQEKIQLFIDVVEKFNIVTQVWKSIKEKLLSPASNPQLDKKGSKSKQMNIKTVRNKSIIPMENDGQTSGLLNYLYTQNPNNISISASSSGTGLLYDVLLPNEKYWTSKNSSGSSITFTLNNNKTIQLDTYYIRSTNSVGLQSYILEGKCGTSWLKLDERRYNDSTLANGVTMYIKPHFLFNAFRITSIGLDTSGSYFLSLKNFDVFGNLFES